MKTAIISFGHIDSIITISKYMSAEIDVDLYVVLSQQRKKESIIDFQETKVKSGLLGGEITKDILGDKIISYIAGKFNFYFFIYDSFKIFNPKNLLSAWRLARILRKNRYDVIHFNGNNLQQVLISLFCPFVPKVFTIHDYLGHSGERKYLAEAFNRFLIKSKLYKILHSRFNFEQSKAASEERTAVIPFAELEVFKLWENKSVPEENNTIIFFGRMSGYKGLECLLAAIPIIQKEIADLKVIIAGEPPRERSAGKIEYPRACEVINRHVPNEQLVELIQRSSVVVCPYVDATQSGVIMTAYALNKPVVATNVGGISEVVADGITGLLVPACEPEKLAAAVMSLIKNRQKRKEISENIDKKNKNGSYNWGIAAKKTIEVYRKALGRKNK